MFQQFPPSRLPNFVKLICSLNYPSPLGLEELQPNRIAVAMQWLAVSHSSRRTKLSCARRKIQLRTSIPMPDAHHPRAPGTYVFRKCHFRSRNLPVPIEDNLDFHRDAILAALGCIVGWVRHFHFRHRHAAIRVIEFIGLRRPFMRYNARSAAPKSFSGVSPSSG
jgi:hypothetical protein